MIASRRARRAPLALFFSFVTAAVALALTAVAAPLAAGQDSSQPSAAFDGAGTYVLVNVDLDRALAAADGDRGANVITTDRVSPLAQWEISRNGDGTWSLRNAATGGWLDGDGARSDWNVDQSETLRSDDRWEINRLSHEEYELINVALGRRLDADRGHQDWNVDLAVASRGDRKWMFEPARDGSACESPASDVGLATAQSRFDFETTWTRLTTAIDGNPNLRTIAVVDHAAAAAAAGLDLPPNRLVVFGNPAIGTPLMADERRIGIDLPQKILVWGDNEAVCVGFNSAGYLRARGVGDLPQLDVIDMALPGLAGAATGTLVMPAEQPASAPGFVVAASANDFETTWSKLIAVIEASPANIAFTVDHDANSGGVLGGTRLAVFGNPNLGTPLMQREPTAGIDLPLKILVIEREGRGSETIVEVIATPVSDLGQRHGLAPNDTVLMPLVGAINRFIEVATTDG